jgi:hypothetical protein
MATAPDPLLAITKLYHFTDVRNLPVIKRLEGLWSTAKLRKGKCEFFTDVEFNPHRSINCQARSAALFLSLMKRGDLEGALQSPDAFVQNLLKSNYRPQLRADDFATQGLFSAPR